MIEAFDTVNVDTGFVRLSLDFIGVNHTHLRGRPLLLLVVCDRPIAR